MTGAGAPSARGRSSGPTPATRARLGLAPIGEALSVVRTSAARIRSRFFLLGFVSTLVLLLPLLGQAFGKYAGVHPRIAASVLAAVSIAVAFQLRHHRAATTPGTTVLRWSFAVLMLAILASFHWSGQMIVMEDAYMDTLFPEYKFTRVLIVLLPLVAVSLAIGPFAASSSFLSGLEAASVVAGILAVFQFAMDIDHFTTGTRSDGSSTMVKFSVISLSLIILNLQAVAQTWLCRRVTWPRILLYLGIALGCIVSYFLLSQRTALALTGLYAALLLFRLTPGPMSGALLAAVAIYGGFGGLHALAFGSGGITSALAEFESAFGRMQRMFDISDVSYENRVEMAAYCMRRGFDQFLTGHGLGSFLDHFGAHYPHNIVAEAFFEQGVVGLVTTSVLLWLAVATCLKLIRNPATDVVFLGIAVHWVYAFKANSEIEFGYVAFWMAIGVALAGAASRSSPASR